MGNAATGNARGTTMNARTSKWGRWVRVTGLAALQGAMRAHGYDAATMRKLCFENWLAVLERVWGG